MAAGPIIVPDKSKLNFFGPANILNPANTFRLTLHTSALTPNPSTVEVYADLTGELPTGGGYTAGGIVLPNDALTQTGGTVKFTSDTATWTATGSGIPAWRTGWIRAVGTFNGKVDPIVGYFLGDSTNVDVPATTAPNTLTFTPNAAGIITAS